MSLPRYPKYKDSGVEWLGEVPAHWGVEHMKRKLRLLTEKTERRDHPVALENIESWTGRFISTDTEFEGEGIAFSAGDLLFGKLRPYLAKAYVAEVAGEAVGDFLVMRPRTDVDSRFVQYQILNREFIAVVDGSTFGSKMPRASWEFVGAMRVASPPMSEQERITAFLDRETAKIDDFQQVIRSPVVIQQLAVMMIGSTFKRINVEEIRALVVPSPPPAEQHEIAVVLEDKNEQADGLITEAQRAIDLLQERRTALISAAVTGQIDVRAASDRVEVAS